MIQLALGQHRTLVYSTGVDESDVPDRLLRSYKFRLYPTRAQERKMTFALRACCELYNAALQERREAWTKQHVSITRFGQHGELAGACDARHELKSVYAQILYDSLDRVDRAFRAFFRRAKAACRHAQCRVGRPCEEARRCAR